jgi:hypothetical protein
MDLQGGLPIIKQDIMTVVSAIWSRKLMGFSALNTTFITLLLKKEVVEQPKDFRPISLVHSFVKLVTKTMANRLAGRLNEMVSLIQTYKVLSSRDDSYKITSY